MSPKEVATLLKQSSENIRLWSIEFSRHLSKSAAPEQRGKHRAYNESDISVLALIADYKNRDIPFPAIHDALDNGERLTPVLASADKVHQTQIATLQTQLAEARKEIEKQTERALLAEIETKVLRAQKAELDAKIDRLNREIGRLEASKGSE